MKYAVFPQNRMYLKDSDETPAILPDVLYINDLTTPSEMIYNPINCVTTKFVRQSTNKVRCPIFCVAVCDVMLKNAVCISQQINCCRQFYVLVNIFQCTRSAGTVSVWGAKEVLPTIPTVWLWLTRLGVRGAHYPKPHQCGWCLIMSITTAFYNTPPTENLSDLTTVISM